MEQAGHLLPGMTVRPSAWGISIPDDATEHDHIFVATTCGIAISDDSGATWTHVDPCTATNAAYCGAGFAYYDVAARVVGGNIQVDVCGDKGVFRSTNGGMTWSAPDPASPTRIVGVAAAMRPRNPCHIDTAPQDANTVYLANFSGLTPPPPPQFCVSRLMESTTGGSVGSWVNMNVTASNCRDAWVVTHPSLDGNANRFEVYFGDSTRVRNQRCNSGNTPRCLAGSANWANADTGAHSDPSDIAFDTSTANGCPQILSTDGGISTTGDCGVNWVDGNRGLHALDIRGGLAGTVDAGHTDLYFGTQDNGLYSSQDNAATWSRFGPDVYNVLADHTPPVNVFFRQCFGCSDSTAGAHLTPIGAFNDPPGNIPVIAVAAQFGNQRYAFMTSDNAMPPNWTVRVTTDNGATWSQMGPVLPGPPAVIGDLSNIRASGTAAAPTFHLLLSVAGARASTA